VAAAASNAIEDAPRSLPEAKAPALARMRRNNNVPIQLPQEVVDALIEGMRPRRRRSTPALLALPPIPEDTSAGAIVAPRGKTRSPVRRRLRQKTPPPPVAPQPRQPRGRYGQYTTG
jgi:hypothetical protein